MRRAALGFVAAVAVGLPVCLALGCRASVGEHPTARNGLHACDEAGVLSALLLPRTSEGSRLLILAHGW